PRYPLRCGIDPRPPPEKAWRHRVRDRSATGPRPPAAAHPRRTTMSWNFMEPASRGHIDRVWRRESEGMLALAADPAVWEAPTGAGHWQVRDVIGHLVDTTEAYFVSFDAARGRGS